MFTLTAYVIVAAVAVVGISYLSKTEWWERHICADFSKSGHNDICFDCNEINNDICYTINCPIMLSENREGEKIIF